MQYRIQLRNIENQFLNSCSRYLATWEYFRSLSFAFRISYRYSSVIVKKMLAVLQQILMSLFLPNPSSIEYKVKSEEFDTKLDFPNWIFAIDGKHIRTDALIIQVHCTLITKIIFQLYYWQWSTWTINVLRWILACLEEIGIAE